MFLPNIQLNQLPWRTNSMVEEAPHKPALGVLLYLSTFLHYPVAMRTVPSIQVCSGVGSHG